MKNNIDISAGFHIVLSIAIHHDTHIYALRTQCGQTGTELLTEVKANIHPQVIITRSLKEQTEG